MIYIGMVLRLMKDGLFLLFKGKGSLPKNQVVEKPVFDKRAYGQVMHLLNGGEFFI